MSGGGHNTGIQFELFCCCMDTFVCNMLQNGPIVDAEIVQDIGPQVDQEILFSEPEYKRVDCKRDKEDKQESAE